MIAAEFILLLLGRKVVSTELLFVISLSASMGRVMTLSGIA